MSCINEGRDQKKNNVVQNLRAHQVKTILIMISKYLGILIEDTFGNNMDHTCTMKQHS